MYLELIDIDNFCQDLPKIESPKMFESGKFAKKGLFSQQIFGPVKSYYCACSRTGYYGRSSKISKCKSCDVDIVSSTERRKRLARIELPFPVLNPIFYYVLCSIKPSLKSILYNMLLYKRAYYMDENQLLKKTAPGGGVFDEDGTPIEVDKFEGLSGVKKLVDHYIETDETGREEIEFLKENLDKMTMKNVIVIPPDFRPCGKNQNGVDVSDELNHHYSFLIVRTNHLNNNEVPLRETDDIYRSNYRYIQRAVFNLYDHVLSKMSKKKGLIRSNILGKRVDFSGRAVISPDPTLQLDECRVPYYMLMEILKPQLTAYLVNKRICNRPNIAYEMIDDCIKNQDESLFETVQKFVSDKVCILNRQPTLHRLGVLGFKISVHLGKTIQIHPMLCHPYNADFDGDSYYGLVNVSDSGGQTSEIHVSDLLSKYEFELVDSKEKSSGVVVEKFRPKQELFIKAIDPNTGDVESKPISEYSVHKNISMYDICDTKNRFKSFSASDDHSLIVYDEIKEEIIKISPKDLLESPEGKYLIQEETNNEKNNHRN